MTRQQPAYLCAGERAGVCRCVPVCRGACRERAGVCQCAGSVPVCASVPGACQCVPGLRQGCACDACPALHLIGRLS